MENDMTSQPSPTPTSPNANLKDIAERIKVALGYAPDDTSVEVTATEISASDLAQLEAAGGVAFFPEKPENKEANKPAEGQATTNKPPVTGEKALDDVFQKAGNVDKLKTAIDLLIYAVRNQQPFHSAFEAYGVLDYMLADVKKELYADKIDTPLLDASLTTLAVSALFALIVRPDLN
jgi:hypothetical protein